MNARRSILIQLLALGLAVGMSFALWPLFQGSGREGEGPMFGASFLLPTAMAGLLAGTLGVVRGRHVPAVGIYRAFALAAGFYVVEQGMLLGMALAHGVVTIRLILGLVFGVFIGLSPVIARVEQNPWFGVRTPWTLGSRRVWRETHRATARLWAFGGLLGAVLAFVAPVWVAIAYLLALAFSPVLVSYAVWRGMGRP